MYTEKFLQQVHRKLIEADVKYLYDLKEPQLTRVENVQEKIENSLQDFDELFKEIVSQEADEEELDAEETFEQTM